MITRVLKGVFNDTSTINAMNGRPCIAIITNNVRTKQAHAMYAAEGTDEAPFPWTHSHELTEGEMLKLHDDITAIYPPESQPVAELIEAPQNNFDGLMGSFATHFASFGIKSLNIDFK